MHPLGVALGLAYLMGGLVGQAPAARRGVSSTRWWWLVVAFMALTVAGARLVYIAADVAYYLQHPAEVWLPPVEGFSFAGGLAVGAALVLIASRRLRVPATSLLDVVGLSYLAGATVVAAAWRTPVSLGAGTFDIVIDALYVTGLFVLLRWLWMRDRSLRSKGATAAASFAGDALLRLGLGGISALVYREAGPLWPGLLRITLLVAACGVAAVRAATHRRPGGMRPFHRPLRRWVGWFVVYAVLLASLVAVRT